MFKEEVTNRVPKPTSLPPIEMSESIDKPESLVGDNKPVESASAEKTASSKRSRSPENGENVDEAGHAKKAKNDEQKNDLRASGETEPAVEKKGETKPAGSETAEETVRKVGQEVDEKNQQPSPTAEDKSSKTKECETECSANSKDEQNVKSAEKSSEKSSEKPKFTFGASSGFSSGFGVAKKPSEAEKKPKDLETSSNDNSQSTPKPAAFGSGFAFGAGFHALNKAKSTSSPKVFENEAEKAEKFEKCKSASSTPTGSKEDEKSSGTESDGVVKLTKQEIKSGEESEESIYQANAKLYQLSDLKDGWKERGVGAIHVNTDRSTGKGRIVMRSRGILKVILNVSLVKGVIIHKGFPASLNGEKFVRIVTVDHEKAPVQYALKTGKEETASELYEHISKLIPS
ncbi:LAFA_0B06920g1_1 [Lachancea sp. 'fantastica']|nr:LAFA_0B06920g1_1 [Lachancea sp. 'fantastica']